MIRLLQFLFLGHWHKWRTLETLLAYSPGDDPRKDIPIGKAVVQQCEHCGKVVRRNLY